VKEVKIEFIEKIEKLQTQIDEMNSKVLGLLEDEESEYDQEEDEEQENEENDDEVQELDHPKTGTIGRHGSAMQNSKKIDTEGDDLAELRESKSFKDLEPPKTTEDVNMKKSSGNDGSSTAHGKNRGQSRNSGGDDASSFSKKLTKGSK
jgi:TolA-binding protein